MAIWNWLYIIMFSSIYVYILLYHIYMYVYEQCFFRSIHSYYLLSIIAQHSVQCVKLQDDMVVERWVHFGSRHVRYLGNPVIIRAIDQQTISKNTVHIQLKS